MSAIAGLFRFSGNPITIEDMQPAANQMNGAHLAQPAFWSKGPIAMLARQRYITEEDYLEQQPWVIDDGRWALVLDGRLDNREELANKLGITHQIKNMADGKLLLCALEKWGKEALPQLIGDFAFAFWDAHTRKLLLARDQLGRRTLYFHQGTDFIAFANTFPALLAIPGVPRKIDELGIADLLILNANHPTSTFYEGIRRVPMASSLQFDAQKMLQSKYWTGRPETQLHFSSDEEYAEAAREQLERAVACRLRAKNGIASTMSGGARLFRRSSHCCSTHQPEQTTHHHLRASRRTGVTTSQPSPLVPRRTTLRQSHCSHVP